MPEQKPQKWDLEPTEFSGHHLDPDWDWNNKLLLRPGSRRAEGKRRKHQVGIVRYTCAGNFCTPSWMALVWENRDH